MVSAPLSLPASPSRVVVIAVAVGLAMAAWIGTPTPAKAAGFDASAAEQQLFNLTNQDRAANGLPPLVFSTNLGNIARAGNAAVCGTIVHGRSQDMIERGYFSHQIPSCNQDVGTAMANAGVQLSSWGENIAWNNYSPQSTAVNQANSAFMGSAGHRANILGNYNQVGIGAAMAPGSWNGYNGVIMLTEVFINGPVTSSTPAGGVVMDRFGGLHPFGNKSFPTSGAAYWPGFAIARSVGLLPDGSGGYTLDGWGGVHPFGSAPAQNVTAYWFGWDIARGVAVCNGGGYVLDGWGGIHQFGSAPAQAASAYWPGWDIARSIVVKPDCSGGYTMDGYGGLHRFGSASAVADGSHAYWSGWNIARGVVLRADGQSGYTVDGYGGVHGFGGAPSPYFSAYWQGWDIARGLTLNADGNGGYVLDGYGGVHNFGNAGTAGIGAYWPGWDIAGSAVGS